MNNQFQPIGGVYKVYEEKKLPKSNTLMMSRMIDAFSSKTKKS